MVRYALQYESGRYVRLDQSSGGYPYEVDLPDAQMWTDIEKMRGYNQIFKDQFKPVRVTFVTEDL